MSYKYSDVPNLVRQELYDAELLKANDDWLIGKPMFDDVSAIFGDGDTLQRTKTGQRAMSDYEDDAAIDFSKMQTSRVDLSLTDYKQDAFYVTDKMKRDSHQAESFFAENVRQSAMAYEREIEKSVLAVANSQTLGNANTINGAAHRFKGSGTSAALTIKDINAVKYAFDKALVPVANRMLIITPEMEFALNELLNITEVSNGSNFNFNVDGLVQTGSGEKLDIVRNIAGINIMVSHNLPDVSAETLAQYDGTSSGAVSGKLCVAMSMADAGCMPFHGVIRQAPSSEFFRNTNYKRDEWSTTAEWGFGLKKAESLVTIAVPNSI